MSAESEDSAGPGQFIKAMSLFYAVLLIADKTRAQALSGLVLVGLGIPVYFVWRALDQS